MGSKNRKDIVKYRKEEKDMTVIREEDIIIPEPIKEPSHFVEYFDIEMAFIPAEIYISNEKMAW